MYQTHSWKIGDPRLKQLVWNHVPFYVFDCIHEHGSGNNVLGTSLPKKYLMRTNSTAKNSAIVVSLHKVSKSIWLYEKVKKKKKKHLGEHFWKMIDAFKKQIMNFSHRYLQRILMKIRRSEGFNPRSHWRFLKILLKGTG